MTIDPAKIAKVKTAMDNRYENKQTNKKNNISGDFTSDTVSYPTVQAVKGYVEGQGYLTTHQDISGKEDLSNKVSSWGGTTSDNRYPSEKLVKDSLDDKANASDIPTKVSDLTNDAGYLTQHQSLDSKTVTVEKQSTAENGYIATYVIKQGGTALSPKINIPKDYLVKSASIETCSTNDSPVTGYVVGDTYFDFVINTKDNSDTDEHLYLLASDLAGTNISDVDSRINQALDDLAEAIYPTTP